VLEATWFTGVVLLGKVVIRGGRVQETINIVRDRSGIVSAVGMIVDRSGVAKPILVVRSWLSLR
jgi:hypothetical protein